MYARSATAGPTHLPGAWHSVWPSATVRPAGDPREPGRRHRSVVQEPKISVSPAELIIRGTASEGLHGLDLGKARASDVEADRRSRRIGVATLQLWERLSVFGPFGVGKVMVLTRSCSDVVDADSSDGVVTARLGAQDRAVVDFEQAHGQVLFGFVRRLGVKDAAAADVVQESLLRLFDALCAGEPIRDLKSWTLHVAYRLAMDEHRRFARGLRLSNTRFRQAVGGDPADDLERRQVWSEVDRLPERQRAVLYLRFRADLAFDDIGVTLGITASAARSHCTQALAVLRGRLAEEVL